MSLSRYYARAGEDRNLIRLVAEELRREWDPAEQFTAPDGDCSAESHARAIVGILATGADLRAVKGYLRRAEESALGAARTTSFDRAQLAGKLWRLMIDTAVENSRASDAGDA